MSETWWQRFKRSSAHTQANIICTIIIAAATCTYAFISYRQLRAIKGQLYQMSQQLPELRKSAQGAADAALAAQKGLEQNDTHFQLEERPYIAQSINSTTGPKWHSNVSDSGKGQLVWDWHMTNYGKTPAQNITFTQEMKLAGGSWKRSHGEAALNVGPPQLQGQDVVDTVISDEIPRSELDRLMRTTDGISIRIKIYYTGLNGNDFETGLCLSRTNAGSIMYCTSDNYIK